MFGLGSRWYRSKLADREIILSRNSNGPIAKWLDSRNEDRAKITKTLKQRTGQTSMFSFLLPVETRRQSNSAFQTRLLQEARRAALPTSSNTVDGDQSSEEPPD